MADATAFRQEKWQETVDIKRQLDELNAKYKELKKYWADLGASELKETDGIGVIETAPGHGVEWKAKKGSVQIGKMKEMGMPDETIDKCRGISKAFSVF